MSGQAAALEQAIAATLRVHSDEPAERGLITGWVLVVESVGADANPYVRVYASDHTPRWRDLGLVQYAASVLKHFIFNTQ